MVDPQAIVQWIDALGSLLFALAFVAALLLFRKPLIAWIATTNSVSLGPIELRRELTAIASKGRQVLDDTSRLQLLIAENRVIEIEIFLQFPFIEGESKDRLEENLNIIKQEIERLKVVSHD